MPNPGIIVVGSANLDLVVSAPTIPRAGETVLGGDLTLVPGGKGANQAVAAARLGAAVTFVGRVGADTFGTTLRANLAAAGVDDHYLITTDGVASGVALIVVSATGENAICVAPGANARLNPADVAAAEPAFTRARVCLVQLEVPTDAVLAALALARRHGVLTILDPAPAPTSVPAGLLDVDVLTPNETEAATLLGLGSDAPAEVVAAGLRARGARLVVLKRGAAGAVVCAGDGPGAAVPGFAVDVVDTTAAGDAFTAGLGVALAEGRGPVDAARFANACGALACTVAGAQPSLPTRAAVERLLGR